MTGENIKTEGHGSVVSGSIWDHLKGKITGIPNTQRTHHPSFLYNFPSNIFSCHTDNYGVGLLHIILKFCESLTKFREEFIYKILTIKTEETACSL